MAQFTFRELTLSEKRSFLLRHPIVLFSVPDPGSATYYKDETLGGYVLVFVKTTGEIIYVLTPFDPSEQDPDGLSYVVNETVKAVKENTEKVFTIAGYTLGASAILIIIIIIFLLILRKDLIKKVLG